MGLIVHFLLLLTYGILNRVRGSARLPKVVCYMLFGVLACVTGYISGMQQVLTEWYYWLALWLIAFLGSYFGFMWCWGKYFPNLYPSYDETCVRIVNAVTTAIYGPYDANTPDPKVLNWKTIAMSWRWIIFFAPKYALLALFHYYMGAPATDMINAFVVCILLLSLVGIIYRVCFTICENTPYAQYNVAMSEVVTGMCVIGVADWIVL